MRSSRGAFTILILLVLAGLIRHVHAEDRALPRKILAFYDAAANPNPYFFPSHQHAEMPLNHLGMEVVHRTVGSYPTEAEMAGYAGILNWLPAGHRIADAGAHCRWLAGQARAGRKLVVWGDYWMIPHDPQGGWAMTPECRELVGLLGAEYLGEYADNPFFMEVSFKDPAMVEFERKLDLSEDLKYRLYRVTDPRARVYLKLKRRDLGGGESSPVFISPAGGFASSTFINYDNRSVDRIQWRLNPFAFFEKAYALEGLPRPDATTLNGRRIFYTHIDGDGIFNVSQLDRKSFSGEVILREILKAHPHVPFTVSIITGYLDMPEYKGERAERLYRELFGLPNVEPASHGHAHPLVWEKGTLALSVPGYRYRPDWEVEHSLQRVNGLLASLGIEKRATLFQWTGDCLPGLEAFDGLSRAGADNLNGGDSRFDSSFNSYSYVSALSLAREGKRQIYGGAPNENVYTNLWQGPYYGFRQVAESFRNTEDPLRLKPINVYYHFYSGEKMASLKVLKDVYGYALSQKIFAVHASDYVRLARDFFEARLTPLPGGGWRVQNGGSLRTIRFDGEGRFVDFGRSSGVLGFKRERGALYVSLDESARHSIFLTTAKPGRPYLQEASFQARDFKPAPDRVSLLKRGWHESEMVLGGLRPHATYRVKSGSEIQSVAADGQGVLSVKFAESEGDGPFRPVTVER